ncbi:hypothetical protein Acr_00g0100310 [Actinidia rufa]|uniref:Uncharacterized protein n=1 Tax=Actinidia rufa TaxID=165716 RepID=A0A7J0E0W1_9ERIC|nr:hypothetical protein Acr_00g0100310 [Actinidia rufa]
MFLDDFVWVSGSLEFRPGDDDLWSFSRYNRNLPNRFNDKFKFRSDVCKEAICAANNKQESRDVDALLEYKTYYRHRIPCRTADFKKASLPPLPIEGRTPRREAFNLEVSGREEGCAVSSLGQSSLDHIGDEEEEEAPGQLVLIRRRSQVVPTPYFKGTSSPIPVLSLDNEDDLVYVLRLSVHRTEAAGTSSSEAGAMSSPGVSVPGKGKGKEPLGQVMVADSTQDLDTSLALTRVVMLPSDSAALADESWDSLRNLLVMQHVHGRLGPRRADQAHGKAAAVEAALAELQLVVCGLMYERVFTQGVNWARDNYSRQVAEVRSESFFEGWLSCLKKLGVPEDNLAWTRATPVPEFPESLVPYSPMILPGFDEEEFLNRPKEDEVAFEPVPDLAVASDIEVADPAEEVGGAVAKAPGEWPAEETGVDDGDNADQSSTL